MAWIAAPAFLTASQYVKRMTSLPSWLSSTTQAVGAAALFCAVLGIFWGLAALGAAARRAGDSWGRVVSWSAGAGIVLLPLYGLGANLLVLAIAVLIGRGRLAGVHVRLPASALLAGLVAAMFGAGWYVREDAVYLYVLSFAAGAVEGVALIWLARTTRPM